MKNLIVCKIELPGKFIVTENPEETLSTLNVDSFFKNTLLNQYKELLIDPICTSKGLIGGSTNYSMRKLDLSPENFERFFSAYFNELEASYSPETHIKSLDDTYYRMKWAIIGDSFNKRF